jgi:hypothetical protein
MNYRVCDNSNGLTKEKSAFHNRTVGKANIQFSATIYTIEMKDEDLVFEDWKMTKDRIKHFDDIVIRLRLESVPITVAIIGAGLGSFQYMSKVIFRINNYSLSAASIVLLLAAIYILPVCVLDVFHYKLLVIAVNHAKSIEQQERFQGKLQITTKLTSPTLTIIHLVFAMMIYAGLFIAAIILAYMVNLM